jgi:hypothetical protein
MIKMAQMTNGTIIVNGDNGDNDDPLATLAPIATLAPTVPLENHHCH